MLMSATFCILDKDELSGNSEIHQYKDSRIPLARKTMDVTNDKLTKLHLRKPGYG